MDYKIIKTKYDEFLAEAKKQLAIDHDDYRHLKVDMLDFCCRSNSHIPYAGVPSETKLDSDETEMLLHNEFEENHEVFYLEQLKDYLTECKNKKPEYKKLVDFVEDEIVAKNKELAEQTAKVYKVQDGIGYYNLKNEHSFDLVVLHKGAPALVICQEKAFSRIFDKVENMNIVCIVGRESDGEVFVVRNDRYMNSADPQDFFWHHELLLAKKMSDEYVVLEKEEKELTSDDFFWLETE
ncbi:MAG: hypothetical protein ACRCZ2_06215 [Fusobacteriaceae bacterium]